MPDSNSALAAEWAEALSLDGTIDQLLQAGTLSGVEIACRLGTSEKRVSIRRQAVGLGSATRRHAGRALAAAQAMLVQIDELSPPTRSRLDATLTRELRHRGRLDAPALAALGFGADALAAHAARAGLHMDLPALARGLGSERAERVAAAVGHAGKFICGLSGGKRPRLHLACAGCAKSGGCGHAPHAANFLAADAKGKPLMCMRAAKAARARALLKSEADARQALEAHGFWRAADGFGYQGHNRPVRLRCPEGHIERVVYGKALAGRRCQQCGGHFGQRILQRTLEAMFGGEWIEEDRATFGFEIDCWCPAPARGHAGPIAAAYDGIQHTGVDIFGVGPAKMAASLALDEKRARVLAANNIPFIRVPDLTELLQKLDPVQQPAVFAAIETAVLAAGLRIPAYQRFDIRAISTGRAADMRRGAERLGVALLTPHWPGPEGQVSWHCPVHRRTATTKARLFLQRRTCCDGAPRGGATAAAERHRRTAAAAGLVLVEAGRHAQKPTIWCCGAGHRFSKSCETVERQRQTGIPICPWCELAGRHHPASIQARRAARSWTAGDLARQAGVTRDAVISAERDGECTAEQLRRIAQTLCTTPEAIHLRRRRDGAQLSLFAWAA